MSSLAIECTHLFVAMKDLRMQYVVVASKKNSLDLMRALKIKSKQMGLDDVRVQKSGCLNYCEQGHLCYLS